MIEKEFRNEDPSGKIIAFMLLIVSLMGGGPFAVKLGLQGIPPLKMAFFRCILGVIAVGGLGNRTIGVNFRKNNRLRPRSGRFGFPTEPDTKRKT